MSNHLPSSAPPQGCTRAVCAYCGFLTSAGPVNRCSHCGAGIRILEPFAVDCGWCGFSNRRDLSDMCRSCGGPLPALPGGNPGPRPPPVPRLLPRGYEFRISYTKNVYVMIGMMFSIVFCWSIIFPAIGIPLWIMGKKWATRKLNALKFGTPTRGTVISVEKDLSQAINNRHPWKIDYSYELQDGTFHGSATAWDPANSKRNPGDALWVVVVPEDKECNAIWPPIR